MNAILAQFESRAALHEALARLESAGITGVETYTPMPADEEPVRSPLPLCMFVAGMLGFAGFFALMTYANVHAYPTNYGGRPNFAWPTYVPIAFELGVLCAMVTGFVGYFIVCRMPLLYDPIDECSAFGRASRDGWFVSIGNEEADQLRAARRVLASLEPTSIEEYDG
jgi:hypothetical protein